VLITAPVTVSPSQTTIIDQASGTAVPLASAHITVRGTTLTAFGRHRVASLTLERDSLNRPALLTHPANATSGSGNDIIVGLDLTVSGNVVVQGADGTLVASRIDVAGRGFPAASGPGAGSNSAISTLGAAGGGHGGFGAKGGKIVGGMPYGSILAPRDFGSGGGSHFVNPGGTGGGAIKLHVLGTLTLGGSIIADGAPGILRAGSGAGGSIWIEANQIQGAGEISADGANGASGWGGGAGGRILITANASAYRGGVSASGGESLYSIERGAAGSIARLAPGQLSPDLSFSAVPEGRVVTGAAALTPVVGIAALRSVSLRGGANVYFTDLKSIDLPLSLSDASIGEFPELQTVQGDVIVTGVSRLVVDSLRDFPASLTLSASSIARLAPGRTRFAGNVALVGPANQLVVGSSTNEILVAGNMTIDARSTLFGNGLGFPGGEGYGAGFASNTVSVGGTGAGHGGFGESFSSLNGGPRYGSISQPGLPGSGGGASIGLVGGSGGAAIRLEVVGTLTVNGMISVAGVLGQGAGGGGSGGSLFIWSPRVQGTGLIAADGGSSVGTSGVLGGAGAGGRVAVYSCSVALPSANIRAARGGFSGNSQPGTVYRGSSAISVMQPTFIEALSGLNLPVSVSANSTLGAISYQWRRLDGSGEFIPLENSGRFSGVRTPTLFISEADCSDGGVFDCLITDSCGSFPSKPIPLAINPLADFNQDGAIDGEDVMRFFYAWNVADPSADVNRDRGIDADDVVLFLDRFDLGC
jgi:hypothetical protein